jgi:hypothetical protein
VLTELEESSATIALMVVVTCIVHRIISKFVEIYHITGVPSLGMVQKMCDLTVDILKKD